MHNAPAVSYPVGRSRFQAGLLLLTALSGLAVGLLWFDQDDLTGWRQILFGFTLLLVTVIATQAWFNAPQGTLDWDGLIWHWTSGQTADCTDLRVHFDLQLVLVLSLRSQPTHDRIWLWPECHTSVTHWNALRCAVFSQVKS